MFKLFGLEHLVVLGLLAACALLVAWGCRRLGHTGRARLGRILAFLLISYTATVYLQKGVAGELDWRYALPLELCHWVLAAVVISLFRPSQLLSEIAYFCGTAGTLQAILTPEIYSGFPSWESVFFFWSHGSMLLGILFLVVGRDFRPRAHSVFRMMVVVNLYAAIVGAFDALTRCNYGYLCQKPTLPTIMDYLGPWPWYLASLEFVALASFWLLDLPWKIYSHHRPAATPH
jgi:hypothetical integral membrane protein (TIGR02206 family)